MLDIREQERRSSNFELLRIVAAMGVIMHHVALRALRNPMPTYNEVVFLFLYIFFICDVDVFLMISGYFMAYAKKIDLKKPFEVVLQLLILWIVMFCINLYTGGSEFNVESLILLMIPRDYFIVMYVALFLMAPYINLMLDSLTEKKFKLMLLVLFLLFPVWNSGIQVVEEIIGVSMPNASTVSQSGNLGGRSIVNFVMCYILGTAIRKKYISFKKPVIVLLACAACNLLLYALGFGVSMNYMSPVTLVEAMAFVMLAEKLKLQSRIVNFIAKASLTVYIVHVPMVVSHIDYIDFVGKPFINMLAEYAAIVLAAYGVGVVMYYAYSYLTATFRKKIGAKLSKIEISV